ncbi:uncharacterized protein LOC122135951 [Cyprinus carpio]|uniref:Uncharacterized protein LOC122135951 n=1 Tax=Cyprinus carpio TaxID=7962 RepID=A0A9Q9VXT0_CYPCA|nr:uncharacterized protein LOC122135951 [Cyprinus carpio]
MQLYDDREQQLLTGIISHVTQQHSAEYWCGVQSDQGHKSFITRVLVSVTDVPKTTSSSSSSSSASVFKTSTSTITSESSNKLKGLYLIITLVLVLLVLIIIGVLLVFLYMKHQSRAGGDSSSQTGAEKHEMVFHTGGDYEEIKDTHKQLPTNPSVIPDCVYATVKKATGDSQILITSAEDLNYAVVNFQKNPNCPDSVNYSVVDFQKKADCPDSVRLRYNQDYSEYADVNHLTA